MASLLAIWCWVTNFILRLRSRSVRFRAIAPQPRADRYVAWSGFNAWKLDVSISNGKFSIATLGSDSGLAEFHRRVFPMENFPLPPLVQTQVWLNSTGVGISNGKFSIVTLGSDSGLAEFNRRVNSNGKFSIVTVAEIQVWLGSTRVGISHRHLL